MDDFLAVLYRTAPPETHSLIREWIEEVVTYNLRVADAMVSKRADGKYEVAVTVLAEKESWSGAGESASVELGESLQIGLFAAHPDRAGIADNLLQLGRYNLTSGENKINIIVEERPEVVGVDPM